MVTANPMVRLCLLAHRRFARLDAPTSVGRELHRPDCYEVAMTSHLDAEDPVSALWKLTRSTSPAKGSRPRSWCGVDHRPALDDSAEHHAALRRSDRPR